MAFGYKIRDNDIVDTRLELEQSIINNLSVFFSNFLQKLSYEIKLVSSITTQDGSTISAGSHKVTRTRPNTKRNYIKTVVNKFAVMDIFLALPGQTRKKITRIVLAPVDILSYNPTREDLNTQSNSIGILISSGAITNLPTSPTVPPTFTPPVPPTFTPPVPPTFTPPVPPTPPTDEVPNFILNDRGLVRIRFINGREEDVTPQDAIFYLSKGAVLVNPPTIAPVTNIAVSGAGASPTKPGANATTLYDWYRAQGKTLPSISERSIVYESFGLGPARTYIGSAEQNIALLAKLKAQ